MTSTAKHRKSRLPRRLTVAPLALVALAASAAALLPTTSAGAAVTVSGNLVKDPGFVNGTGAWTAPAGVSMAVVAGHNGNKAIALTNTTSAALTANLNDKANTVARTVKGATYTASAWIRVSTPNISAAVREGEWNGSVSPAKPAVTSAWLTTTDWRYVKVDYVAATDGASIDLNFLAWALPPKVSFYVSEPSLIATVPVASTSPATSTPPPPPATSTSATPPPATSSSATPAPAPSSSTATSTSTPTPTPAPTTSASSTGKLVFDDEFNGTSVDRSKWNVRNNSWANNELSIDTSRSNNVSVANGVLTLRAQREQYTAYSTTRSYTSGYLDTIGLASRQYGRWEMRAKLPSAKGMWPAFWLRGDHTPGEVDILEAIGGLPQMTVQTVFPNTNDGSVKKSHMYNEPAGNGISNWHVYGFTWTPTSMTWDIDGVKVFTVTSTDASWVSTSFQDTMNIRLNLQVGGSMPNYFNEPVDGSTQFPADFQVDYVRVYDH